MKLCHRVAGDERGSGLVEFAFGFSVVVLAFVGLAQLAISMSLYQDLVSAVQAGARFAATAPFGEPSRDFITPVRNMVLYGTPEPASSPRAAVGGLKEDNVTVHWKRDAAGVPESVTVAVTGYQLPALLRLFRFTNTPSATCAYTGAWKPAPRAPAAGTAR